MSSPGRRLRSCRICRACHLLSLAAAPRRGDQVQMVMWLEWTGGRSVASCWSGSSKMRCDVLLFPLPLLGPQHHVAAALALWSMLGSLSAESIVCDRY